MRIGVIQRDDTRSVLTSSGTLFHMTRALERHVGEVVQLGPDRSQVSKILLNGAKVFNRLSATITEKRISPVHQKLLSQHAARFFHARVVHSGCDALYAPFASVEFARLQTTLPVVYHTDMTWADAVDYYPIYSSLFTFAKREGENIERLAIEKAAGVIVPTDWAARSIRGHYGKPEEDVTVCPYGANFEQEHLPSQADAYTSHQTTPISLLWIGVDWARKGGPIAYQCLLSLLERNLDATLTVCGCFPSAAFKHPRVKVIPFLSKIDPKQRWQLSKLFLEATFFVFPTLGDAAAIVLCEASAHGLPSLVPQTGGITSVIRQGVNGYVLPASATGQDYAEKIIEVLDSPEVYQRLLRTSRQEFEQRLNWDTWGICARDVFARVLKQTKSGSKTLP